ncbi:MAG: coenzyme F420-0:L-glutamate ligase [Bacilli bacterium]
MKKVGTTVRGIRTPVIKEGDNLKDIVVTSVIEASISENFKLQDKDVIAVTEAVVGIASGNYCTVDDIAQDLTNKFNSKSIGVVFPILSRNRFAVLLKGIARAMDKITILISYPKDEVGNAILNEDDLEKYNINPYSHIISEEEYKEKFGTYKHIFTGVNMIDFYRTLCKEENCKIEFVLSNHPEDILKYEKYVLSSDIHSSSKTIKILKENKATKVLGLKDILNESINGSGYNTKYGLLGSNRATEEKVKLFPENSEELIYGIQEQIKQNTGATVEVMVYGDGAFKDPIGGIWELADPVVSPCYTKGLEGSPNEIKLKYLSDNKFASLKGEELNNAIKEEIKNKNKNLVGDITSQGTTPRRYTDLLGSLCDLTSGSGDKGTPVVLVQDYFTNYSD